MSNSIIFPTEPIKANETDWLLRHIGRTSVALETSIQGIVEIIAYSDDATDRPALYQLAKEKHGYIIRNTSEGRDYID